MLTNLILLVSVTLMYSTPLISGRRRLLALRCCQHWY